MLDSPRWSVLPNGVALYKGPYESNTVFVVDEYEPIGWFNGHIAFVGFLTLAKVVQAFHRVFPDDGSQRYGGTTVLTADQFQVFIKHGNTAEPLKGKKS